MQLFGSDPKPAFPSLQQTRSNTAMERERDRERERLASVLSFHTLPPLPTLSLLIYLTDFFFSSIFILGALCTEQEGKNSLSFIHDE